MSQNDMVISNQSAPAFRADLNSALQALASVSSGATEPATKYANQLWYDTGTNTLKKRNEANSAWIEMGTFNEGAGTFTPNAVVQTQATWNTGTSTTESVISPAKLAGAMDLAIASQALGVGQTWQAVTRTAGTVYQNTTGRPIMVAVSGGGNYTQAFVGEANPPTLRIAYNNSAGSGQYEQYHVSFVVPAGHYYKLGGGLSEIRELR